MQFLPFVKTIFVSENSTNDIEKNESMLEEGFIKSTTKCFISLLNKIRSFPLGSRSVSLEITILSNYLLLQSLRCLEHHRGELDNCQNHVRRTLLRVIRQLGLDEEDGSRLKTDQELLFDVIFKNFSNADYPVTAIVSLCCNWSVLMKVTGNVSKAVSCLSSCQLYLPNSLEIDQTAELFDIPFSLMLTSRTACGTDSVTTLSDKINLLQGMLMFCKPDGREQSKQALLEVTARHWHPYTKYMLACLEYKNGQYFDAILLLGKASNNMTDNRKLKALHSSLLGACFSKLGKHHCAIEKYKEALDLDFNRLWPLYCLSEEYQSVGLHDAELETLNLLITALENEEHEGRSSLLYQCICPSNEQITLIQAQYLLAQRCLQLKKYDVACQRYLDVLHSLNKVENFKTGSGTELSLPSVLQIYQEAAFSLLQAKRYTDCETVCDRVLSCDAQSQGLSGYHSDQSQDQSVFSSQTCSQGSQSFNTSSAGSQHRKRLRSSSGELSSPVAKFKEDQRSLLYKADALVHMGQLESAAYCLERSLEQFSLNIDTDTQSSQELEAGPERHSKRQRLDSDGTAVSRETPLPHGVTSPWLSIEHTAAEVFKHLGVAESQKQNYKEGLHYIRLSLQLHSDNATSMYNLTIVLRLLHRQREGATTWIKYRHLDTGSDSFQQANILRRKNQELKSMATEVDTDHRLVWDDVSDHQLVGLDIECLETLIRTK
ncbi:Fanconi anemia group G protein-like isoform X2 [Argopecten irradians]|uniref:Fanconi anemia group G protein-like isoform X2 n=1 Tax=Argopecten irradians TaxID=31199 RepID=UPI00371D1B25